MRSGHHIGTDFTVIAGCLVIADFQNRRALVLGLGDTGLSLARWLVAHGAEVRVADSRDEPPHAQALSRELPGVSLTRGAFNEADFQNTDLIAISPGIDRRQGPVREAIRRGVPIVGDVELFACALTALPQRPKVLAITGSNGKSTVTAMAGAMCREAGLATTVAGNIGPPVLDALWVLEQQGGRSDVFVLELSSFQLESTSSLDADAAAMLNLCEDHMDRYDSLKEYARAKERIFSGAGVQVLNRDDCWSMDMARKGRPCATFGLAAPRSQDEWGLLDGENGPALSNGDHALLPVRELQVTGLHNAANALAALALVQTIAVSERACLAALRQYKGLPHRLERVGVLGGVTFYDDSKGTNVGATVAALSGMAQPIVLIAGGEGKGQDFTPLAAAVAGRAHTVVLIGRDADTIAQAVEASGVRIRRAATMDEAVEIAYRASRPGDAVLLSPACASFDMFRNYGHRGEMFARAVDDLAERAG
jgi:UDP-N-acetylmuramoylalanine--D-glutamate ligase